MITELLQKLDDELMKKEIRKYIDIKDLKRLPLRQLSRIIGLGRGVIDKVR